MNLDTIEALFEDQIKDLYSAENQLVKALPKMAKKASTQSLKDAFTAHLEETRGHVERLQQIGEAIGIKLGGKKCHAMQGLVEEGAEVIEADGEDAVLDAGLIAAAQRVEHYEMAAYGNARAFAERLGNTDAVNLLQQTLDEEGAADKKLTSICQDDVLPMAATNDSSAESSSSKSADSDDEDAAVASRSTATRTSRAAGKTSSRAASSRASSRSTPRRGR